MNEKELAEIVGKVPASITGEVGGDEIIMAFTDGSVAKFYHSQDCCEWVDIEDINGDWADLIGHPLLVADERVSTEEPTLESRDDSNTWTFYTFRSIGGSVDVRWHGSSNGYYSEGVYLYLEQNKPET